MLAELRQKAQVTIPREIIVKLGLSEGDKLDIFEKAFVIPDNADVHVDAALKKVCGALDALGAQRRVGRIFSQKFQLVF